MNQIDANGVEGYLLYNVLTNERFFRVYNEELDQFGSRKHTDYKIHIEDLKIKLLSGVLVQTEQGNYIDWPGLK